MRFCCPPIHLPSRLPLIAPPSPEAPAFEIAVSPEGLACGECQELEPPPVPQPARLLAEVYKSPLPPQPFQLERATFHRSHFAERAQDILAAVRYVSGFAGSRPLTLRCWGLARAWCLLAAAAAPPEVRLKLAGGLEEAASGLGEYLNRPGIAYAGGLPVLFRLAQRDAGAPEPAVTIGK